MRQRSAFKIAGYRVEPDTGWITKASRRTRLEPRAMDVLVYLATKTGEVISKEELRAEVWNGAHVVDEAIKRCISQIRKAFDDDPRTPTLIETTPKRGYRLIAPVQHFAISLRMPPFGNAKQATALFVAGFAILTIAVSTYTLRRPPKETFAEIEFSKNIDWHDVARAHYNKYDLNSIESAISLYEKLVDNNANDDKALAGLADALLQKYLRSDRDERLADRAKKAAQASIRLNSREPDAFKSLGAYYHFHGNRARALELYEQAVERDGGYWSALNNGGEILRDIGEFDDAREWFQCALASTPNKVSVLTRLADLELRDSNVGAAVKQLEFAVRLDPSHREANIALSRARLMQGRPNEATTICDLLEQATESLDSCSLVRGIAAWELEDEETALGVFQSLNTTRSGDYFMLNAKVRLAILNSKGSSVRGNEQIEALIQTISRSKLAGDISNGEAMFLEGLLSAAAEKEDSIVLNLLAGASAAGSASISWIAFDPAFKKLRSNTEFVSDLHKMTDEIMHRESELNVTNKLSPDLRPVCGKSDA